ncbi:hypothetical protein C3L33_15270, partial [Rhododendron williamsianum]
MTRCITVALRTASVGRGEERRRKRVVVAMVEEERDSIGVGGLEDKGKRVKEGKLMCALCDDANSMDEENARLKVWTKQMQEVYEDAEKFIDSYAHKIEQKEVGVLRRYVFIRKAPRKIHRIHNRIRELSRREWTYEIGRTKTFIRPLSVYSMLRTDFARFHEQLKENVKSIEEERSLMQSLLEDIGDLERFDGRLAWLNYMKDVSKAVDDAIAAYEEAMKPNILSLQNRFRVAKTIQEIMHKIQDLSDRKRVHGIDFGKTGKAHNVLNMAGNPHQRQPPSVHIKRREIVSFYDDLQAVALLLTNNEHRSIISIVGMEGIELIDRNVVQATKKKLNGEVKKCRLPYAIREIWSLQEPKKAAYPESHTDKNSKLSPTGRKIRHLTHHSDGDGVCFNHILGDTTDLSPASLLPGYEHVISFRSFDTREGSQPGKELGKFLKDCISSRYLLSLRVLDLERVFRPELPKALAYFHQHSAYFNMEDGTARHLYLDEDYRCRFPEPSDYSLTDLQTLWGLFVDEDSPVKDGLDRLINLKRLGVTSRLMSSRPEAMPSQDSLLEAVANWVQKLKLLQSLRLKSFDKQGKPWQLPKLDLTGHTNLSSLYLLGSIAENNVLASMLPRDVLASMLPRALIELTLSGSGLKENPMQF